jgi:hypothetical protein
MRAGGRADDHDEVEDMLAIKLICLYLRHKHIRTDGTERCDGDH